MSKSTISRKTRIKLFGLTIVKSVFFVPTFLFSFVLMFVEVIFMICTKNKFKTNWTKIYTDWCIKITKSILRIEINLLLKRTK